VLNLSSNSVFSYSSSDTILFSFNISYVNYYILIVPFLSSFLPAECKDDGNDSFTSSILLSNILLLVSFIYLSSRANNYYLGYVSRLKLNIWASS
jgi:hypothetical protein